jgi:hypothetical protein
MTRRWTTLALLAVALLAPAATAQDPLSDPAKVGPRMAALETGRKVVDRLVVCFDEGSFLREIGKWDAERYWPVLLWDSHLVPKFVSAFGPEQVLLAKPDARKVGLEAALAAIGEARGGEAARPLGVVLLAEGSPELLGGVAVAAGRMQTPIVLETEKKHATRIPHDEMEALRKRLRTAVGKVVRLEDVDFVTVANDMPFAYSPPPDVHPGAYTVDDAAAREDDLTRWAWIGRLVGGPVRSVYMAMGALFLRPEKALVFSRYAPNHAAFGPYDPKPPVLEALGAFFQVEAVRHPKATLARWREIQWPAGNRFGFVFVNSSGGATSWSTSKGGATHFDVPDSVPAVVHYTHSGSAGRPFDVDSIAGRWLANGAYVYFGSHAEPYLQAFVPASVLAARAKAGTPLGAAMRHVYSPALVGRRKMKVGGVEKIVSFNLSGPWKLAYFGDPCFRLRTEAPAREAPESLRKDYFARERDLLRAREIDGARRRRIAVGLAALESPEVDDSGWKKLARAAAEEERDALQLEMVRVWVAGVRRSLADDPAKRRRRLEVPRAIRGIAKAGAASPDAARLVTELAKELVAGADDDGERVRRALETACCFAHSKGSRKPFYDWVVAECGRLDLDPRDLAKAVAKRDWVSDEIEKLVKDALKEPKPPAKPGK